MSSYKKIAVIGSNGQLGTDIVQVLQEKFSIVPLTRSDLDITSSDNVQSLITSLKPDVVINCAAFHRLDDCETDPITAFTVNSIGALNVSLACASVGAKCVYISTDYVFDGLTQSSYTETDMANPINVYGTSKLAAEHLVRQNSPNHLIIRVAGLYGKAGSSGKGGNFIESILGKIKSGEPLKVVTDIKTNPTYTRHVAETLMILLDSNMSGLFHVTNSDSTTWYEFTKEIVKITENNVPVERILSSQYPSKANRPENSSLSSSNLHDIGIEMPTWKDGLRQYLIEKNYI